MKSTDHAPSAPARGKAARCAAYTLAAGAAATATTTDAAVVYSGPQNINIGSGFSQAVNLDNDAFNDIVLKNYVFGTPYQGASINFAPGRLVAFNAGLNYVTKLGSGFTVDSSSVSPSIFAGSMAFGASNPNAQFNNATDAFVGLSFPAGGNTYYGWVRVDVNNAAGSFVVKDWAYESNAGQGIVTGAGIVPEPSALGLLAAGATGLAAMRRRRVA